MEKIIIFCCTNRPDSYTSKISKIYSDALNNKSIENEVFEFSNLPRDIAFSETFGKRSPEFDDLIKKLISSQNKFIFIAPEYNGSYPGILKSFLDSVHPKEWVNKKACLVGVSSGRAGNLRGMEHLAGVLQYLKMHVYYNKLPISLVDKILDGNGKFLSMDQQKVCEQQLEGFIHY